MPKQVLPRQNLTELVSEPCYQTAEFWTAYKDLAARQLGTVVSSKELQIMLRPADDYHYIVSEGDPIRLSWASQSRYLSEEEVVKAGRNAYCCLGPLNFGQGKNYWLIDSALAQLQEHQIVGDHDEVLKHVDSLRIPARMRNYLRGLSSETQPCTKREFIELIACELQEAGIITFQAAFHSADLQTAHNLLDSANQVRQQRFSINGAKGGRMGMEMTRRYLDTEALKIHCSSLLGREPFEELHEQYRLLQIENVGKFFKSLKESRDIGRQFEWFVVLLDNFNVYKRGLYGTHYAYYAFPYQDYPPVTGLKENTRFDIVVNDTEGEERFVSLLQAKLIIPETLDGQIAVLANGHSFDYYAEPIDFVFMDIPVSKKVGYIDCNGPNKHQLCLLASTARSKMKSVALRLYDHYTKGTALPKVLERDIASRVNDGTWVGVG